MATAKVSGTKTSLLDAVNTGLTVLGETPITSLSIQSLSGSLPPTENVVRLIIAEVNNDVNSKGWWFNTSGNNITFDDMTNTSTAFDSDTPEEAIRYITIRAARVVQSRFLSNENLHKFTYEEELASLATLIQANVRQGGYNSDLSFSDYPSELRGLGIEEHTFLQQQSDQKINTIRLATELKQIGLLTEQTTTQQKETTLKTNQAALVAQQKLSEVQTTQLVTAQKNKTNSDKALADKLALTEVKKALDVVADTTLKGKQGSLVDNQAATELKQALDIVAATTLKGKQGSLIDNQAATELKTALLQVSQAANIDKQALTEVKRALDIVADTTLKGKQGSLVDNQAATELKRALDLVADTTIKGKQGSLIDNQAATELKQALDIVAATTLKGKQGSLIDNQAATELKQALLQVSQAAFLDKQALTEVKRALDIVADTTLKGKQGSFVDNQAATELKKALDIVADTTLKGKQGSLIDNQAATELKQALLQVSQAALLDKQALTEVKKALDIVKDSEVKGAQKGLVNSQKAFTDQQKLSEVQNTTFIQKQALTEVQRALDVAADVTLKGKQGSFIDNQAATELKRALDIVQDTALKVSQEALVDNQAATELKRALDIVQDTAVKVSQESLLDNQAATELKRALDIVADTTLKGSQKSLVDNQAATELKRALDLVADTTIKGKQGNLIDKQAESEVKEALRKVAETSLLNDQEQLVVNQAATELKRALDIVADTALKTAQKELLEQQKLTEVKETTKRSADTTLVLRTADKTLADKRLVDATELKTDVESNLLVTQRNKLEEERAVGSTVESSYYTGILAGTQNSYQDFAAELRILGFEETTFQAMPASKKQEVLLDAAAYRTGQGSGVSHTGSSLPIVNNILRLIGEPKVTNVNQNSLGVAAYELLTETNKELQARGWWFNTENDVELETVPLDNTTVDIFGGTFDYTPPYNIMGQPATQTFTSKTFIVNNRPVYNLTEDDGDVITIKYSTNVGDGLVEGWIMENSTTIANGGLPSQLTVGDTLRPWLDANGEVTSRFSNFVGITETTHVPIGDTAINAEANDYDTSVRTTSGVKALYDLKKKSFAQFSGTIKSRVIYLRDFDDTPSKYLEYLTVRVALLITELYPKSTIDVQRLRKLEGELETYFKDRENDQGNYNVFDSYDAASRVGINRNYNLV